MSNSVRSLSYKLSRPGQINAPGISQESKQAVESLLLTDAEKHHCFFNSSGFHNHLSHHLLVAYDLGASPAHLKKIYEEESKSQRAIILEERDANIVVTDDNWIQYLGNQSAYAAFVKFFSERIERNGSTAVLEQYVFDENANTDEKRMLVCLMSGLFHPFIQVGHGVEFGDDTLIATGLAQTAVHNPTAPEAYKFEYSLHNASNDPKQSLTVLEIIRAVYDSEALHPPMPYEPNALYGARLKPLTTGERLTEILKITSQFHIADPTSQTELDSKIQEFVWASVLLLFATGRSGHKPRLDFFMMHFVTSSIWLHPLIGTLKSPVAKVNLLRAFLSTILLAMLARGRPRINAQLLMSYTATPRPPTTQPLFTLTRTAMGSPLDDAEYNPWPAIISDSLYHPEAHATKTLRTLIFASQQYGTTAAGQVVGAYGKSGVQPTHDGIEKVDGTIFVRAAGVLMDYMGWVTHGQEARPDWDRSAHGWDAAWDTEVD
ncbi:hypothetical protein FA15DRAFT_665290 [Coprinopsis marcescibilis]|uniref:Uncharacterized protein n=1 Tax=Coprinopsis marcescibilis TaxID=230819 RepID=A0A5C3L7E2_COPMA|nr:hypothetical protein FA15DRAFT_665290 [Coprinopsis marcescibilis]